MFVCEKCGNSDMLYIGINKKGEYYCRRCIAFQGEMAKNHSIENNGDIVEKLDYQLSVEQEEISQKVKEAFINKKNSLIYAVCGAGKTELVYKTMAYALNNKMQVGFTIPRKDVVIELEERIKNAFPNCKVISLYQNHHQQLEGDIILLTTHQLFRYKDYFDLLIIDETDAFPYKGNELLKYFFTHSIRGNYIMMSATPLIEMIEEIKKNNGEYFTLMKRYHNHPLIVPKIILMPFFKEIYLIYKIKQFQKKHLPVLIFAPTIFLVEKVYHQIHLYLKKGNYVHSKREDRDQIIKDFKNNQYDYLITSSILERGITIKNLQVIIYEASHKVFDSNSLIQISGRVGRKIDAWDGEVIYLCSHINLDIKNSIDKIKEANTYVESM